MTSKLRPVPPGSSNRGGRPRKFSNAVNSGDEREMLVGLRRMIAARLEGSIPAHSMAALIKQLRDIDREIRAIDVRAAEAAEAEAYDDADDEAAWDSQAI